MKSWTKRQADARMKILSNAIELTGISNLVGFWGYDAKEKDQNGEKIHKIVLGQDYYNSISFVIADYKRKTWLETFKNICNTYALERAIKEI